MPASANTELVTATKSWIRSCVRFFELRIRHGWPGQRWSLDNENAETDEQKNPTTAAQAARITSGTVIVGGDSWAWCPASAGIFSGPKNVMKKARNV